LEGLVKEVEMIEGETPRPRQSATMKRVRWAIAALVLLSGVALTAFPILASYQNGSASMRRIDADGWALIDWSEYPPKSIAIRTQLELDQISQEATKRQLERWGEAEGVVKFRKSIEKFDFSTEALVLISFLHPYADFDAGIGAPRLNSKTLTCSVWFRSLGHKVRHPAAAPTCYTVAVKRDRVDEVIVRIGSGEPQSLALK
jgi:hypothetical protein